MVWIIGCNGMLGTQICRTLKENKVDYAGTDSDVSILDFQALEKFASGKKISFIVNCAAYTAVDKAESDADFARALNAEGPRNLARLAKKIGVPFFHISTDYVFDGTSSSPIAEETPVIPNVDFYIKNMTKDHLTPEYIQSLLDRIAALEESSSALNRQELLQLNAELDAILTYLRQ